MCLPTFNTAVTGDGCEGEDITYEISSDFTATRLVVDSVDQPAANSFTVTGTSNASYEIILETANGCKDSFTYTTPVLEECCPPENCIRQLSDFTITKRVP